MSTNFSNRELREQAFAQIEVPIRAKYLKEIFSRMFSLLENYCVGYFMLLSDQVDDAYIRLRRTGEAIVKTNGFEELQEPFNSLLPESLHSMGGEADMDWDCGLRDGLSSYRGRILEFCVDVGAKQSDDEWLSIFLKPFDDFIEAYRKDKAAKERAWISSVGKAAESSQAKSKAETSTPTKADQDSELVSNEKASAMNDVDPRKVFVVHGRNERIRNGMFAFLRALHLDPIEWTKAIEMTGKGSPYVGEVLEVALANAQAIVVVMTPDDEARLRSEFVKQHDPDYEKQLTPQARPNVLFEAGLALGRAPERTILVEVGSLRPFSDIAGRHTIRLDSTMGKRQELANRLKTAGCAVSISGTDWHTEGDFNIPNDEMVSSPVAEPDGDFASIETYELYEAEVELLKVFAMLGEESFPASHMADLSQLNLQRAIYHLDNLEKHGHLYVSVSWTGAPSVYGLSQKGRAYLVENHLI